MEKDTNSTNLEFCLAFYETIGGDIYISLSGKYSIHFLGIFINENGVIRTAESWVQLDDINFDIIISEECYDLADKIFNKLYKELIDDFKREIITLYQSLTIELEINSIMYKIKINNEIYMMKLIDAVDLTDYFEIMKRLKSVIAPVKYYGIIDIPFYGTVYKFGYMINEYIPNEYENLEKELKIKLFPQLDSIIEQVHTAGVSNIDLHGDNLLYSKSNDRLYLIDIDDLRLSLMRANDDDTKLSLFKSWVIDE